MKACKKFLLDNIIYINVGIYLLTLLLEVVSVVYANNTLGKLINIIRYMTYIVFVIQIIKDWINGNKITWPIVLMLFLSIMITIFSKNKYTMIFTIVAIAVRNLNFKKILKITLTMYCIVFFTVINLSLLKVMPDWVYHRGTTARHSLGFFYATDAIGIYLIIILMYFYLKKSKARIEEIILLETINVFLYKMTDGRLSFILITILLAGLMLSKIKFLRNLFKNKIVLKALKITCITLPVVLFITFNLFTYLYWCHNGFAEKLNDLLSDRLKYTSEAYQNYGIPIFGKDIKWNGWGGYGHNNAEEMKNFKYNFVDSSYAKIVFDNGIIFTGIVILAYTVTLVKNYNNKNYWLILALFVVLIWGVVEQYLFYIGRNIFVLALIPLLETGNIKCLEYNNIKKIKGKINEKINH